MFIDKKNTSFKELGVTLLEYVVVITALGFIAYEIAVTFQGNQDAFYKKLSSGMEDWYPQGYSPS